MVFHRIRGTRFQDPKWLLQLLNNLANKQKEHLNCNYYNDNSFIFEQKLTNSKNDNFILPPLIKEQSLECKDAIYTYDDNSTFLSDGKKGAIVYSSDLYKLDAVSNKYKTNNSPTNYLTEFIEKKIKLA